MTYLDRGDKVVFCEMVQHHYDGPNPWNWNINKRIPAGTPAVVTFSLTSGTTAVMLETGERVVTTEQNLLRVGD